MLLSKSAPEAHLLQVACMASNIDGPPTSKSFTDYVEATHVSKAYMPTERTLLFVKQTGKHLHWLSKATFEL